LSAVRSRIELTAGRSRIDLSGGWSRIERLSLIVVLLHYSTACRPWLRLTNAHLIILVNWQKSQIVEY